MDQTRRLRRVGVSRPFHRRPVDGVRIRVVVDHSPVGLVGGRHELQWEVSRSFPARFGPQIPHALFPDLSGKGIPLPRSYAFRESQELQTIESITGLRL